MDRLTDKKCNPKQLSPQTLAFIGDTVYDMLAREYLVCEANRPVGELNKRKVKLVNCKTQSDAVKQLMSDLTEDEVDVYKRGRNAFTKNTPKNADVADYHAATGLEALFGYLYLNGEINRLNELFEKIINAA
ncbi:MAG: ribonuclease III [Ruminococcus sp.]|nr:ribonuclease III [Ruminococcus sp.]